MLECTHLHVVYREMPPNRSNAPVNFQWFHKMLTSRHFHMANGQRIEKAKAEFDSFLCQITFRLVDGCLSAFARPDSANIYMN